MRRLTSCLFVGLPDRGFPGLTDLAYSFALDLVFAELAAETNFSGSKSKGEMELFTCLLPIAILRIISREVDSLRMRWRAI
jgi:hypothetical protein